jgi:hypothetical protein
MSKLGSRAYSQSGITVPQNIAKNIFPFLEKMNQFKNQSKKVDERKLN